MRLTGPRSVAVLAFASVVAGVAFLLLPAPWKTAAPPVAGKPALSQVQGQTPAAVLVAPVDLAPEESQSLAPSVASAPLAIEVVAEVPAPVESPAPAAKSSATTPGRRPKPELADPVARMALFHVGADPEAEMYWYAAINDPTLSENERQDLIEDLNEDGISDPHNPSLMDLPLLVNRLAVIEEAAPYAMDQVNADAFAEAYKDLVNLVIGLQP